MNLLQLIASSSFITLNKNLIKIFGLEGAAIVGTFASIHNYNEQQNPNYDGWFYVTYDKIEDELGLSKHIASNAIEALMSRGILKDKRVGIPCRRYFKFQEAELLDSLRLKILTTSREQDSPQAREVLASQGEEKFNRNNNKDKNKSSLSVKSRTLEECLAHAEKEKYSIDVEKFWKYYFGDPTDLPKAGMAKLMMSWASKPENQVVRKSQTTGAKVEIETPEIAEIRSTIKFTVGQQDRDDCQLFAGKIEKDGEGFKIFVTSEKALRYAEVLGQINVKIEVK